MNKTSQKRMLLYNQQINKKKSFLIRINFSIQYQPMRPKQRIRKIYTESDLPENTSNAEDQLTKTNNVNIKDLELNLTDPGMNKSLTEQKNSTKNYVYKNAHFYMPNKFNKMNRKQLIKKLPDINLSSLNTISKPLKLAPLQTKQQDRHSSSNKKNTFLLNSLFEILKPQNSTNNGELARLKERTLKFNTGNKNISIDYENEFINLNTVTTNSSTKNRGPKVLQNEITRLSGHNNIIRRKIVSQQKSRPKFMDKSLQKLKQTTFQHFCRPIKHEDYNEFNLIQNSQRPKQTFENLEIITFYNKFPNYGQNKKKEQERVQPRSNKEIKVNQRELREPRNNTGAKLKTQQSYLCQEENEFIFEKK